MRTLFLLGLLIGVLLAPAAAQEAGSVQIIDGDAARSLDVTVNAGSVADGVLQITTATDAAVLVTLGENLAFALSTAQMADPHDLLLLSTNGTVLTIVRNAAPGSLKRINFSAPVAAVLQLAGGGAKAQTIRPGTQIQTRRLQNDQDRSPISE